MERKKFYVFSIIGMKFIMKKKKLIMKKKKCILKNEVYYEEEEVFIYESLFIWTVCVPIHLY